MGGGGGGGGVDTNDWRKMHLKMLSALVIRSIFANNINIEANSLDPNQIAV